MSAAGVSAAPKGKEEPIQVDMLSGTVAEVAETALRVKNLVGLCRMGVIGYGDDECAKEDEDKPTSTGILAVTTRALEGVLEDLASAEKDLLHLQFQLGSLAQ